MKRISSIIIAVALLLGMAQCKKQETPASEGKTVKITLNVGGNNNGSRVNVNPPHVAFEQYDEIVVASNGKYVGTLTHNGNVFEGEITGATENQPLYFYFLGNKDLQYTMDGDNIVGCTLNISDQSAELPVLSYAASRQTYPSANNEYTAELDNQCALVKFTYDAGTDEAVMVGGMYTEAIVNFAEHRISPMATTGTITLHPDPDAQNNAVKWAILLPQNAVEVASVTIGNDNNFTASVPTVGVGQYYVGDDNNGVMIESATPSVPAGAIDGKFTINANGDQVYFSQGNLQYQASTNTWQFAEHQYDYVGNANSSISQTNSGWIDLFGWGTSGYDHGATCYQPWSTSSSDNDYYAYGQFYNNLYDGNGQADWGYNAINNGGNTENSGWRTLTQPEWNYFFNTRSTASGIRYAKATVNGVNGVILLPDNWTASIYTLNDANGGNYDSNTISAADWTNELEANGAVFLPAAGLRNGASVNNAGSYGYYWSASFFSKGYGCSVYLDSGGLGTGGGNKCNHGISVRLVRFAEN